MAKGQGKLHRLGVHQHRSFARSGKARPENPDGRISRVRFWPQFSTSFIVDGLQETSPVGAFSTLRAHLISISTPACWDLCGGRAEPLDQKRRARP